VSYANAMDAPRENVARGTVFSLVVIPLGVIAWVVLWNFGFIASLVAFGVAFGAMTLYRIGSGGFLGFNGAVRGTIITVVTLLLAFFGGVVSDMITAWTDGTGGSAIESLVTPEFWTTFQMVLAEPGLVSSYLPDFGLALLFGALGCFSVLRSAFRGGSAPAPSVQPETPEAGAAAPDNAAPPAPFDALEDPRSTP
jgi:hypothetical protein